MERSMSPDIRAAREELKRLAEQWIEINDLPGVVRRARRLLEVHRIRAADALQLGAALYAVGDEPERNELVTFDDRLAACAEREGFRIVGVDAALSIQRSNRCLQAPEVALEGREAQLGRGPGDEDRGEEEDRGEAGRRTRRITVISGRWKRYIA